MPSLPGPIFDKVQGVDGHTKEKTTAMTSSRRSFLEMMAVGPLSVAAARAAATTCKAASRHLSHRSDTIYGFEQAGRRRVGGATSLHRSRPRSWFRVATACERVVHAKRIRAHGGSRGAGLRRQEIAARRWCSACKLRTTEAAVRYAKQAKKVGADAIISLPPADEKDPESRG